MEWRAARDAVSLPVLLDGGVRVGRGIDGELRQEQGEGEWARRGSREGVRMRTGGEGLRRRHGRLRLRLHKPELGFNGEAGEHGSLL